MVLELINDNFEDIDEALTLTNLDLFTLGHMADELRKESCGDTVSFVVNRNINFTNICTGNCKFCAFRRQEPFFLSKEEIRERVDAAYA
ncbi:MAG: hypothetical protein ACXQS2_04490 [Methermicoccaceae archaeon]